ncbi:trefoil factor 2 [Suricata suricatta]|uniref:Trefoil factor 2 n=1 Tax=Suricata suricatta TaxID=37032 RepID=A0A673T374_SURSU|nr:trefoil factor 2 [Suricata suricatta]
MGPQAARLLAVLLVLGLWAPAGAQKPSPCRCSRISPQKRENCGFPGITSDQCFASGCCFDSNVAGVPWCFRPLPKQVSEECVMEVSARKNCGYPGISPEECASRKCCFSDNIFQVPWCFFPISVEDCHY